MSVTSILRHRRDSSADWTANNPVLEDGQLGFETDTLKFKFGNGVTAWNSLSYAGAVSVVWGTITGTLSDQTDLQTALNAKAATVHTHTAANITDFDAAVAANSAVAANTAKVSNANHTGDVVGSTALTISLGAVTLAKMADMATNSLIYRKTAGAGSPEVNSLATLKTDLGLTGTNSGDQTSIVGISGTKAQFDTACSDGNFMYVGDAPTAHTHDDSYYTESEVDTFLNSKLELEADDTLELPLASTPTAAGASAVKLFGRQIANRMLPAFIGPSGLGNFIQPFLARNKIGCWSPPGNGTTVPGVFGFTAPTITNFTATARNVATTNLFTRMRRLGFVTAAAAGSVGHWRCAAAQFTVGDSGTGLGGFTYIVRFGISDAAAVAGARMFMGIGSSTAPANVEPSTLTQRIGIGHGAADTNLKLFYGGSAAQTPIDLGASFPTDTLSVDMYELALFSPPNSGDVYWEVKRLNTGDIASGTITNSGSTVLPTNTTLLTPWGYRTNNATALAVGLDVALAYIETDF